MGYIGRTPTGSILTSADIADGSISTAKLEDNAVTTAKITDNAVTAAKYVEYPAYRNLIINGDMSIAQRGTSHSIGSNATYRIDRWRDGAIYNTSAPTGVFTVSQSTDVPSGQGFASSQKWDCTTAQSSLGAEQGWGVQQRIEAQNLTHLAFGTSSAKTLTLTFWIKSNKTGTYGIEVRSHDASRQFISSYTIDSANTWEKKTITITGDTGGSGIANDNGIGFWVRWIWSAGTTIDGATLNSWTATATEIAPTGQVNLADSTSNELYWTGAQLEVGTTASDFEFLPHDVNLRRCERYYETNEGGYQGPVYGTASDMRVTVQFRTKKRANPTLIQISSNENCCSGVTVVVGSIDETLGARVQGTNVFSAGAGKFFNSKFSADAEL